VYGLSPFSLFLIFTILRMQTLLSSQKKKKILWRIRRETHKKGVQIFCISFFPSLPPHCLNCTQTSPSISSQEVDTFFPSVYPPHNWKKGMSKKRLPFFHFWCVCWVGFRGKGFPCAKRNGNIFFCVCQCLIGGGNVKKQQQRNEKPKRKERVWLDPFTSWLWLPSCF